MDDPIDKIIEDATKDLEYHKSMVDGIELRIRAFKALKRYEQDES